MTNDEKARKIFELPYYSLGDLAMICFANNLESIDEAIELVFNRLINLIPLPNTLIN